MKTTNAKSNAFKTPAPLSAKTQKVSPRLRRPKVKVHQPEPEAETEDDVPEIEYMAPKEVPLSDDMDDFPKDWKFPMFEGKNMTRGIYGAYHNPIEDDGRPKKLREFEEGLEREKKKRDVEFDKVFSAEMAKDEAEMRRYMGIDVPKKEALKPASTNAPKRTTTGLSTMKARSAAHALSPSAAPSFAAPTAAVKCRVPTGVLASKKTTKPFAESTVSRRAAAVAATNSTIGYAQGRAGRTAPAARKPLSNVTKPAPFSAARRPASAATSAAPTRSNLTNAARSRSAFSRSSSAATDATLVQEEQPCRTAEDEERELELMLLARSEEEDEDAWSNSFNNQLQPGPLEEELEDFQFKLPEGF
jgi:hypothetical protein